MRVLIRADASTAMGSGHVMRCLALAMELRTRGAEVLFLSRSHPGNLCPWLEAKGWPVLTLPLGTSPGDGALAHSAWLGASQQEDLQAGLQALVGQADFDWVIVDHYGLDAQWEAGMRGRCRRVAVIDDLADRNHDCDLLLDANLQGGAGRYQGRVPSACQILLGPRFALLRPEFAGIRQPGGRQPGPVERILVSLGGGDPDNATGTVLQALEQVALEGRAVDVVMGSGSRHLSKVLAQADGIPGVQVHVQTDAMASLMQRAGLMIGAAGSTTWERCCLGLPAVLVTIAENQRDIALTGARAGVAWYLGHAPEVPSSRIADALRRLLARPSLLARMARRGQALVDGRGASRVAVALTGIARVAVVSDADSWINRDLGNLVEEWRSAGHQVTWVHRVAELPSGDCAFFLGCGQMAGPAILARHAHNLVVHLSDLPKGKGWSPLTWQILEGRDEIPVTLFEAQAAVDSGPIYAQEHLVFRGDELLDELHEAQGAATLAACRTFLAGYPANLDQARPQRGEATFYRKRGPEDSALDPGLSLKEQFNRLRVADNERYPAFFELHGIRYRLQITKVPSANRSPAGGDGS